MLLLLWLLGQAARAAGILSGIETTTSVSAASRISWHSALEAAAHCGAPQAIHGEPLPTTGFHMEHCEGNESQSMLDICTAENEARREAVFMANSTSSHTLDPRLLTLYCGQTSCRADAPACHQIEQCLCYLRSTRKLAEDSVDCSAAPFSSSPALFHSFWAGCPPAAPSLRLQVLSFLATQPRNCTKLMLWTSNKAAAAKLQRSLYTADENSIGGPEGAKLIAAAFASSRIVVRPLNITEEAGLVGPAMLSATREPGFCMQPAQCSRRNIGYSDLVRFLVLGAHGGIYLDADVVMLRSMLPLWELEFAEYWGDEASLNTGVLRLRHRSPASNAILAALSARGGLQGCKAWHPDELLKVVMSRKLFLRKFVALSHAFFDPTWCCQQCDRKYVKVAANRTYPDHRIVRDRKLEEPARWAQRALHGGAFAWHYHDSFSNIQSGSILFEMARLFVSMAQK